jgi:hypothetical protein
MPAKVDGASVGNMSVRLRKAAECCTGEIFESSASGCCVNRLWTLFDHLVGAVEQGGRHRGSDAQRAAVRRPRRL